MTKILLSTVALATLSMADVSNTEISGGLNFFYDTNDGGKPSMFSQGASAGQVGANIAVTSDLGAGLKAKAEVTVLDTLGLENNVVSNVWEVGTDSPMWMSEAWLEKTIGKTTLKFGRQTVDSPLFMTETWSIAKNTFDGALAVNTDIENTTLVAGYFGRHNSAGVGMGSVARDKFTTLGTDGAYAAGVVNTSVADTTLQAWYYDVVKNSKSYFVQADTKVSNFDLGASSLSFHNNSSLTISDSKMDFFGVIDQVINSVDIARNRPNGDDKDPRALGMQNAIKLLDDLMEHVQRNQTQAGVQSQTLDAEFQRSELLIVSTKTLRSGVIDVDIAEAAMNLQQLTLNYQAMLSTVGKVSQLSLVNYL